MHIRKIAASTALLVLLAAGCGGNSVGDNVAEKILEGSEGIGDVNLDSSNDSFDMTVEGEDGETISVSGSGEGDDFSMVIEGDNGETMTFGSGEIPEGMNTPVADGGNVISTMSAEGLVNVVIEYPTSMYDELVEMYDDFFSGDGVQRFESSSSEGSGTQRAVTWMPADGTTQVTLSDCDSSGSDELDAACVAVMEFGE